MAESLRYSRRKLLYTLGLGSVGAATWSTPAAAFRGQTSPLSNLLTRLTPPLRSAGLEQWAGAVGSNFVVAGESGPVTVKLVAVSPLQSAGSRPADLRPASFTAVFEGAAGSRFPAGNRTYVFEQSNGLRFEIFVGGATVNGSKAQLIAIFN